MSSSSIIDKPVDLQLFAKHQQSLLLAEHEAEVASSALSSSLDSSSASPATRRLLQAAGHALTGLVLVNSRTGMGGREIGEFSGDAAVTSSSGAGKAKGKEKGKNATTSSAAKGGGDAPALGSHGIRVGDVVRVEDIAGAGRGSGSGKSKAKDAKGENKSDSATGIEGVVTRVGERSIWIAFGSSGGGGGGGGGSSGSDNSQSITDFYGKKLWLIKLANDVTYRRMNQTMSRMAILPPSSHTHLLQVLLGQTSPSLLDSELSSTENITFNDPTLNDSQKEAIRFALASRDIALIHGPPGTGKTYTIIELILQFLARGQKVLVCGPSNISVDNIVERLAAKKVPVIRLGHPARLLESVVSHSLEVVTQTSEAGEIVKTLGRRSMRNIKASARRKHIVRRDKYTPTSRTCAKSTVNARADVHRTSYKLVLLLRLRYMERAGII